MKPIFNHAPMGWNSYDYYDTTVKEEQVKANADYMAAYMKQAGWEYIVVDIQWYAKDAGMMRSKYQYIPFGDYEIDSYGRFQPALNRFPSAAGGKGFAPLAEYIHRLGLKFGIHIMRGIPREAAHRHLPVYGTNTTADTIADPSSICPWNPDMYGVRKDMPESQKYYDSLIQMYADWGVDFIKCDDICNSPLYPDDNFNGWHETEMLHKAIEKSKREIVLSLSPEPAHIERAWQYERNANMWRITDDFWDRWDLLLSMFYRCELWQEHVSEGNYPDCDMLPVGNLGKGFGKERSTSFTKEEQKTMLTLWCMFGSPLMIGAELTKLDSWTLSLLINERIVKLVSNDYIGRQVIRTNTCAVWSKINQKTKESYLAFFNFQDTEQEISCKLDEVVLFRNLPVIEKLKRKEPNLIAVEIWEKKKINLSSLKITVSVAAHGTKLYQLS